MWGSAGSLLVPSLLSAAMDAVLVPGLALAFALTLLFFLHRQPNASPHLPLPPGPPPGWFGNTIPQPFSWRFFEEWTKEYGDVFTVWIGRRPMVVVGTYRASQELLESQSALTADRPWVSGGRAEGGREADGPLTEHHGWGYHVGREADPARQVRRALASLEEVRDGLYSALWHKLTNDWQDAAPRSSTQDGREL